MELDRLLEMLAARQSPQARLVSDEPMQVWSESGWVSANAPLVGGQLNRMLGLAAPPEVRAFVHDLNTQYEFDYLHASGLYRVHVEAVSGRRTVYITRLDENGQPLRSRLYDSASLDFDSAPTAPSVQEEVPAEEASVSWKLEDESEPLPVEMPTPPKRVVPPRTVPPEQEQPATIPTSQASQGTVEAHWFYGHADQSMGPHTKEQMAALIASGALLEETMVFDSRIGDWQQAKLSALNGFFPLKTEGEWVNPSVKDWRPQTQGELKAEKAFVRLIAGSVLGVVVLLVGWIALAQVRGSNRSYDYSKQFAKKIEIDSSSAATGALHNVHLQRDENDHAQYLGTGQYSNGYLADVECSVTSRDFWSQPEKTDFNSTPHQFAGELGSLVKAKINARLEAEDLDPRVERITLDHGDGNSYTGVVYLDNRSAFAVAAQITEFGTDGSILRWDYQAKLD